MRFSLTKFYPIIFPHIRKFDVTMRDGLESIPKNYNLDDKKVILNKLINVYKPESLEIGSLVSSKICPQMNNSYELYNYANNLYNKNKKVCDFYLLIPPTYKYLNNAKKQNIRNISLITSVSNPFQKKKYNQSIEETKYIIKDALKTSNTTNTTNTTNTSKPFDNVKLYVSCITNCPITGKQDNEYIVNQLYEYLHIDGVSNVCLTDTCGNMRYSDFKHIIDYLNIEMNYKLDKLSLHLHNNDARKYYTTDAIIKYAMYNKINKFDLTSYDNIYFGNGIITVDIKHFNNNLTYNRLYESIYNIFTYGQK
jgi:isopropylmalate/homocitrate/citramalate synthase